MNPRTWHSGPPPHVGWWNASTRRDPTAWRWWNGSGWSIAANRNCESRKAAERAAVRAYFSGLDIEWRHYYPANARVPRCATNTEIDPS